MQQRFVLALVLCFLIVFSWTLVAQKLFPERRRAAGPPVATAPSGGVPSAERSATDPATQMPSAQDAAPRPSYPDRSFTWRNDVLEVDVDSHGAGVPGVRCLGYLEDDRSGPLRLVDPALRSGLALATDAGEATRFLADENWLLVEGGEAERRALFRYELPDGRAVTKSLHLPERGYFLEVELEFEGEGWRGADARCFGPARLRLDASARGSINQRVLAYRRAGGGFSDVAREKVAEIAPVHPDVHVENTPILWAGLESTYFALVIRPVSGDAQDALRSRMIIRQPERAPLPDPKLQSLPFEVGFERAIEPGVPLRFEVFCAPKDRGLLAGFSELGYDELIDYGSVLGWLVRIFLALMAAFHGVGGSWGIAIIFLTVLVKLVLHPINRKNQAVMMEQQKRMAKIQPQMQEIKARYKNDAVKANRAMQELMKEHGVNPAQLFGGCMLMFLQLPIWIALINTFSLALEIRQQSFLYIDDLTRPDRLLGLGLSFPVPLMGPLEYFNLLPILYVIVTVINQKMMPKPTDPQALQQQKLMTFMLIFFGFIFYNFSSGLLLYFLTSSSLGIVEQKIIKKELARKEQRAKAGPK